MSKPGHSCQSMKLAERGKNVSFHSGQVIYKADYLVADPCAFLIIEGKVEVTHKYTALEREVFEHGPGEVFGVLEIYTGTPRITEAVAKGEVHAIAFTRSELERNMIADLRFAILTIKLLSRILRQVNLRIKKL